MNEKNGADTNTHTVMIMGTITNSITMSDFKWSNRNDLYKIDYYIYPTSTPKVVIEKFSYIDCGKLSDNTGRVFNIGGSIDVLSINDVTIGDSVHKEWPLIILAMRNNG